jgi:hypothetical protein
LLLACNSGDDDDIWRTHQVLWEREKEKREKQEAVRKNEEQAK